LKPKFYIDWVSELMVARSALPTRANLYGMIPTEKALSKNRAALMAVVKKRRPISQAAWVA
jgi:hypothetical protein